MNSLTMGEFNGELKDIMSLESKLLNLAAAIGTDIHALVSALNDVAIGPPLSVVRSNEDANGLFVTIQHFRADNTLYKTSNLSGGTSPNYTTRTVVYYEADGTTVKSTQVYSLTYNANGVLISETLQP